MKKKLIIHVDKNHPILIEGLKNLGYKNDEYYNSDLNTILDIINNYNGLVIRSRFKIDKAFIDKAKNLDFIARVGSGTENIDIRYARITLRLTTHYKGALTGADFEVAERIDNLAD